MSTINTTTTIITPTTTTTVIPNIYNNKGCNGIKNCSSFSAWTKCLIDLYNGVSTCQNIYILDENGQAIDLNRLDGIGVGLYNEYDCIVLSTEYGLTLTSMQSEQYADEIFEITPNNFYNMESKYFSTQNVYIAKDDYEICEDSCTTIILGVEDTDCYQMGSIVFNPITYTGDIYMEIVEHKIDCTLAIQDIQGLQCVQSLGCLQYLSGLQGLQGINCLQGLSGLQCLQGVQGLQCLEVIQNKINENQCQNTGKCVVTMNGIPKEINFDTKTKLSNVIDGSDQMVVSVMSMSAKNVPTITMIDKITFYCSSGFFNKGMLKICYAGSKIPIIAGKLTAKIVLKFNENDSEYPGEIKIIECFQIANVQTPVSFDGITPQPEPESYDDFAIIYVDVLPTAGWNTMNKIYAITIEGTTNCTAYITKKTKTSDGYSYAWEKISDNYIINATSAGAKAANINLVNGENESNTSTITLKHIESENGSMIKFNRKDGNTIEADVTDIDGGTL